MTIDIISYTQEQLAALSAEKVSEIREAQTKKNRLEAQLQERLIKEKNSLIDKGIYPSDIWGKIQSKLMAEYEKQVETLRESLIFYLHYVADDMPATPPSAPYTVDYSLSVEERARIVRDYYNNAYQNDYERYVAFLKDDVAKVYIGELYAPLHDYFYAEE